MRILGWLPESRVRRPTGTTDSFQLRPLFRPDLPGPLVVEFDGWLVEFRMNERVTTSSGRRRPGGRLSVGVLTGPSGRTRGTPDDSPALTPAA